MLYMFPLTTKLTTAPSPRVYLEKMGDRFTTFKLLLLPGKPKYACHIHKSYDATTSKIIAGCFPRPVNMPFHEDGQFHHGQCMQSMLPSIPENPRWAFTL